MLVDALALHVACLTSLSGKRSGRCWWRLMPNDDTPETGLREQAAGGGCGRGRPGGGRGRGGGRAQARGRGRAGQRKGLGKGQLGPTTFSSRTLESRTLKSRTLDEEGRRAGGTCASLLVPNVLAQLGLASIDINAPLKTFPNSAFFHPTAQYLPTPILLLLRLRPDSCHDGSSASQA
ncbi:hypothetical protein GGR56DRAFT_410327 [Xylariaceae sp. FL0804]|nr:hypothetical protein GGR56DRAFT_410327 [Xylariaceae sp. FL0804]